MYSTRASEGGRQNAYDKALLIFREGKRRLDEVNKDLDKEKTQTYIDYKHKEREVKNELIDLIKDKKKFTKEAKQRERSKTKKVNSKSRKQNAGEEEKNKKLPKLRIERNLDCFPEITCTDVNVPKIMKRSISSQSEFHNWICGLPKVGNATLNTKPSSVFNSKTTKRNLMSDAEQAFQDLEQKRCSKVENIVYSVPISIGPSKMEGDADTKSRKSSMALVKHDRRTNLKLPPVNEVAL